MDNELRSMLQAVLKEALEPLKEEMQVIKSDVQGLKDDVHTLKSDVQGLKDDVQTLKAGQDELNHMVRAIHDRQEETDAKLEALTMDTHKVRGELSSQKQGQERQDKILASLALRSLEQETELRELKRII
ncbi:hypothetical protein SAMN05421736_109146 [Evansella caseinilytica]|uniref:Uncharacterized protein n=1 Tax=Evansella caseinilytica TaxID=1503961 RepID=A0A1H3RZD3_9BACI|nr:hypothetical protein [Evansella caseinilytica]SDZ31106.1 hypothetical protein SAMN05421736_109146 [Evansella caseinilytica]